VHHLFLKPLSAGISEKKEWPLDMDGASKMFDFRRHSNRARLGKLYCHDESDVFRRADD